MVNTIIDLIKNIASEKHGLANIFMDCAHVDGITQRKARV